MNRKRPRKWLIIDLYCYIVLLHICLSLFDNVLDEICHRRLRWWYKENVQYISNRMHTVCVLFCSVVVWYWGLDRSVKSILIFMLFNKDFQSWLLIDWRLCRQPMRSQVWKYLLTNMDFTWDHLSNRSSWSIWPMSCYDVLKPYIKQTNWLILIYKGHWIYRYNASSVYIRWIGHKHAWCPYSTYDDILGLLLINTSYKRWIYYLLSPHHNPALLDIGAVTYIFVSKISRIFFQLITYRLFGAKPINCCTILMANFSENWIKMQQLSFKKKTFKISSAT